jgi:probable HAF family extracellular repeat protein
VTDLGTLGGTYSRATSINDSGQVVGNSNIAGDPGNNIHHAFLYSNGTMIDLGTMGGTNSYANSINNLKQVVGVTDWGATIWDISVDTVYDLNILVNGATGWTLENATDINDKGQIVGTGKLNGQEHIFLLTPVAPPSVSAPVQTGSDVAVTLTPFVNLNFSSVNTAGTVEMQPTTGSENISVADGTVYKPVSGTSYDLTCTAEISGMATVCLSYDPLNVAVNGNLLRMMHFNGSEWVDITTGVDTSIGKVCGQTESFSPFVIAYPVTAQISASTGSFVYSRATKLYTGNITLSNKGTVPVTIPVAVALNGLTSGVTLVNALGIHNGAPYITIANNGLAAGASLTIPVRFSNPSNAKINFTPVTFQE